MKRLLIVLVLLLSGFMTTGCTTTESFAERQLRHKQIVDLNMRMAGDDWDYIWLIDQSSSLTRWSPWIGI